MSRDTAMHNSFCHFRSFGCSYSGYKFGEEIILKGFFSVYCCKIINLFRVDSLGFRVSKTVPMHTQTLQHFLFAPNVRSISLFVDLSLQEAVKILTRKQ